jgi:hypothetical protein
MPNKPLPKHLVVIKHQGDQEICVRMFDKDAADVLIPMFGEFADIDGVINVNEVADDSRDVIEALLDQIESKPIVEKGDAIRRIILKGMLNEVRQEVKNTGIEWHYHIEVHPKYDALEVCQYLHESWIEWQKDHGVDMEEFRGKFGDLFDE